MSKRKAKSSSSSDQSQTKKKKKPSPQKGEEPSIPDDIWIQKIFSFLSGHELFNNPRLVCKLWNDRILSTQHATIKVSLNDKKSRKKFIRNAGIFQNVAGLVLHGKLSKMIKKFAQLESWHCLKSLELRNAKLKDKNIKQLANGNLKHLTSLDLSNNSIGNEGIEYLSNNGNITNLTSLKIYNNPNIDEQGAKYLLSGNLKNLKTLNYQTLGKQDDNNKFLAMTDHFCGETPFTVHSFDNIDELTEYIFKYYLRYWSQYGRESLGLRNDYLVDENGEKRNEPVLRKAVFALPLGKIFEMAIFEVGDMVFNEQEREAIVSLVYGQVLTEELWNKVDESTPFAIIEREIGFEHKTYQVIGKSNMLKHIEKFRQDEKENNFFKTISKFMITPEGEYLENGIYSICVGEALTSQFTLLSLQNKTTYL